MTGSIPFTTAAISWKGPALNRKPHFFLMATIDGGNARAEHEAGCLAPFDSSQPRDIAELGGGSLPFIGYLKRGFSIPRKLGGELCLSMLLLKHHKDNIMRLRNKMLDRDSSPL